jgi:hypothetical protein
MDMHLTPEMEQLIGRYLALGPYTSPEAVVREALLAFHAKESLRRQGLPEPPADASPLLAWLHATAGPRLGLEAVQRRLSALAGSMADTIRAERDERF